MILSYVQLLLACFGFWSAWEAVVRALRRQWAMALSFGGIVLFCLLIPKSEWLLLALVDGALLIIARRTEGHPPSDAAYPRKPRPGGESVWQVSVVGLLPITLLETLIWLSGGGSLAAWFMDWLLLFVLAGGVAAFLTRENSLPPVHTSAWPRWREKLEHVLKVIFDCWYLRTLRPAWSEVRVAMVAPFSARLAVSVSRLRRRLRHEFTDLIEVISGTPPTLNALSSRHVLLERLWMRISVSGPVGLPPWQTHFPHETTKYITLAGEVRVRNWTQGDLRCPCVYQYYKPDGKLLAEKREVVLIKRDWERFSFAWEWGWPEPGHWEPGTYRVELYLAGELFQIAGFIIEPPPPPPSWTLADLLSQATVQFYASQTEYDNRQDNVRFPQNSTRQIICVLTVLNRCYQHHDNTYQVTAHGYTPEGKILWEDRRDWLVKAGEEEPAISWAWQEAGPWQAGAYRVEILINGEDFAWGAFAIE